MCFHQLCVAVHMKRILPRTFLSPPTLMKYPISVNATTTTIARLQKQMHTILLKTRNNVVNMKATLIDTLLSLIWMAFKLLYKQERMMDLNTVFRQ